MTTDSQLQAVAFLVDAITDGRWHRAGTMTALREVRDRPLWLITRAAVTAAATRTDQTSPAVIAKPGPHWHDTATNDKPQHAELPTWKSDPPKPPLDPSVAKLARHAAGHHDRRPDTDCPDCRKETP